VLRCVTATQLSDTTQATTDLRESGTDDRLSQWRRTSEKLIPKNIFSKTICLTGATGFLGRHVVARLAECGYQNVFIVQHSDYDLVKAEDVERLYRDVNPQIVIHLAAVVGGIGANSKRPGTFFYDNLMMGANLIEGARIHGLEKLVQVGTVCSYPKLASVPFKEEDLWSGYPEETNAPYGIAKKALLVQAQAYRQQYGLNSIYLMPANLYGPGDNFDPDSSHVIPALIKKFVDATESGRSEVEVWGTGNATREFLYVADAAEGIVLATEKYNEGEPVNLGSGREISIRDLVHHIATELGFEGDIRWDASKPDGQPRRSLDTTRARELFGFSAHTDFKEGLRRTIESYRVIRAKAKPAVQS
jgi:GDP-L-fucose synthase